VYIYYKYIFATCINVYITYLIHWYVSSIHFRDISRWRVVLFVHIPSRTIVPGHFYVWKECGIFCLLCMSVWVVVCIYTHSTHEFLFMISIHVFNMLCIHIIYIWMWIYVYVYTYIYVYIYINKHMCKCVCICINVYIYIHMLFDRRGGGFGMFVWVVVCSQTCFYIRLEKCFCRTIVQGGQDP